MIRANAYAYGLLPLIRPAIYKRLPQIILLEIYYLFLRANFNIIAVMAAPISISAIKSNPNPVTNAANAKISAVKALNKSMAISATIRSATAKTNKYAITPLEAPFQSALLKVICNAINPPMIIKTQNCHLSKQRNNCTIVAKNTLNDFLTPDVRPAAVKFCAHES